MGSPPAGARFEATLSTDVVLYDVSRLLPTGAGAYAKRDVSKISVAFAHKSGADGLPGFAGVQAMARFCSAPAPPLGNGRGWPGAPYHIWTSRIPDTVGSKLVVYRCQPDEIRCYHTGGDANTIGLGIAMQGAYDGQWDLLASGRPKVEVEPTHAAMVCWQALWLWLCDKHNIELPDGVSGHFEARRFGAQKNKPVCPGDHLRQWVLDFRKGPMPDEVNRTDTLPEVPTVDTHEWNAFCPPVIELQGALKLLGYDPGPLDGIWGYRSRGALETFQRAHELVPDGWYGVKSAKKLLSLLRDRGLAGRDVFRVHLLRLGV